MDNLKVVGHRIRTLRLKKGWKQDKLAEEAGLSTNHVGNVERAETSITVGTLDKITKALDITLEDLFNLSDEIGRSKNPEVLTDIIDLVALRSPDEQEDVLHITETFLKRIDKNKLK